MKKGESEETVIFRPYFTTKDGRKIWAKTYGKKVFRIVVRNVDRSSENPGKDADDRKNTGE